MIVVDDAVVEDDDQTNDLKRETIDEKIIGQKENEKVWESVWLKSLGDTAYPF
ncbi:hypothetical protein [Bacillus wiedmannii]|uniref:hypothetical protein n=1 Tax=Bacillus wiedmannii TaxID=1890302 RepID=UPI00159BC9C5|nr:hypothetical protein [Bacillus wiedmannii]